MSFKSFSTSKDAKKAESQKDAVKKVNPAPTPSAGGTKDVPKKDAS